MGNEAAILAELEKQQAEDIKRDKEHEEQNEFQFLKFDLGETKQLRILPPPQGLGEEMPWRLFWYHYGVGENGRERITCPAYYVVEEGEQARTCPVCAKVSRLIKSKDKQTKEKGYNMKAKQRAVLQVIDRGNPKAGPLLWEISYTTFKLIRKLALKPYVGLKLFSTEEGFDIEVTRSNEKKDVNPYIVGLILEETKDGVVSVISPLTTDKGQFEAWMEGLYDLTRYMSYEYSEEQMEQIMEGASPKALRKGSYNSDSDEREDPAGSSSKRRKV